MRVSSDEEASFILGMRHVHSSVCAGELKVSRGRLQVITSKSGHYKPTSVQVASQLDSDNGTNVR